VGKLVAGLVLFLAIGGGIMTMKDNVGAGLVVLGLVAIFIFYVFAHDSERREKWSNDGNYYKHETPDEAKRRDWHETYGDKVWIDFKYGCIAKGKHWYGTPEHKKHLEWKENLENELKKGPDIYKTFKDPTKGDGDLF